IDYVIPANDDAAKSIECIMNVLCAAIQEGLEERKLEKDKEAAPEEQEADAEAAQAPAKKLRARKGAKPVDVEAEA
ncbi:MAG: uS2 family ribosomal protein, partial [Bacteroidales bacterium]|nr:uS2 family ribosomal protein [Bacteroidales bacterium]